METVFEIAKDEVLCDEKSARDYVDLLNGIVHDCVNYGFRRGHRNTMAVDLAVACHMLGIGWEDVLDKFVDNGVIVLYEDDEDTYRRVGTVDDYKDRFSWDYMIDPDFYVGVGKSSVDDEMLPVKFVLS